MLVGGGLTSLLSGLFGSWTGKKIVKNLLREKFLVLVEILFIVSGLQMIVSGEMQGLIFSNFKN
jgi:uncharacterized membrane protein YfcA